jgi:hypothetical protein
VVVCVAFAAVLRLPGRWTPLGDNALMSGWTRAVFSAHPPLVGGDARYGWNHLGPWLFYLFAVPVRLLGDSPVGLLVGAAALNVVSLALVLAAARRVAGGRAAAVIVGGALLFLLTAVGDRLIDPWNPYAVQLVFLVTVVSVWAVLNGAWRWLAVAIGAGSLCIQAHITFLVPVAGLVAVGVVYGIVNARRTTARRLIPAAVVAVVAWLPPAIDAVLPGRHNIADVVGFFIRPSHDRAVGFGRAAGAVLRETGLESSWLGWRVPLLGVIDSFTGAGGVLPGLGLLWLACAGISAHRRHDRPLGTLVALVAGLVPLAVLELSQGRGPLFPYLFGWVTILGILTWAVGLVAVVRRPGRTWTAVAIGAVPLMLAGTLAVTAADSGLPRSPRERPSDAALVDRLVNQFEGAVPRRGSYLLVHGQDCFSSIYEHGVTDRLRRDGYRIVVGPNEAVLFGRHMVDPRSQALPTITVLAPYETVPDGSRLVAVDDPLTPTERSEEAMLVDRLTGAYLAAGSQQAADIVRTFDGDTVGLAGFVHPDSALEGALKRVVALRKRGRAVAVVLGPSSVAPELRRGHIGQERVSSPGCTPPT